MSAVRRYSIRLRKERRNYAENDRPTYPPCPACNGSGQREVREISPGRYKGGVCRWCEGTGGIEPTMLQVVYSRWLRILARNRLMRRCDRTKDLRGSTAGA